MDEKIVWLIKSRDEDGLLLLEQSYGKMIKYIVCSIISDKSDAEECISDIYGKAWDKIDSFDSQKGEFRSWLTAISRNTAVNKLKKNSVTHCEIDESMTNDETVEAAVMKKEQRKMISKAVSTLSSFEQQLFYRKYYYMQSVEQIAAETGISHRAAEGRLYRIRKKLRKELGGYFNG
ncbi:MAG: sigma-70 family RNA polymerase sigma factor [Faecalibacterium sp.]|nr:sigma-70 family RNA polymerase sigma factor [Ruminococcus sp.]MCM1392420.1 sigma-70 family RNA polymerase sigma factor [Ruminococcus sp.]MCM1486417.1 sigma-70 family RNA polymerase sigma factor [Faecalibacterium sp.]